MIKKKDQIKIGASEQGTSKQVKDVENLLRKLK